MYSTFSAEVSKQAQVKKDPKDIIIMAAAKDTVGKVCDGFGCTFIVEYKANGLTRPLPARQVTHLRSYIDPNRIQTFI